MSVAHAVKLLGRKERLSEEGARRVTAALLDGGVPELEAGALLALLEERGDALAETKGCVAALGERCFQLLPPDARTRPVVLPSHSGTAGQANLTALIALSLQRLKVPVVVHGVLSAPGRVVAGQVLRELGVLPSVTLSQAHEDLGTKGLAFVPTAVFVAGLAHLLALRSRFGLGGFAERLARFVDPFRGQSLLVLAAQDARERTHLHALVNDSSATFLAFEAQHGEPFVDPRCRPALELWRDGNREVLFTAEASALRGSMNVPQSSDPRVTAAWIQRVMRGEVPMPLPLANQIACCLYGSGYTLDMNQAKAIAAVQTGSLLAA